MAIELANYQATLSWNASDYKKGMAEANSSFSSFSSKMGKLGGGIIAGIGTAITAATGAVIAFGKSSVEAGMSFDSAISQLAATMGTTTDQITALREKAQELGASTSFSATQAAEGLNILAMSGLTAEEQIAAIDTVLNLAAAGSIEMADAASYAIGAVKGFGDSCDNTQYYADLMAKGATLAATDVKGLGEALSGSAATAASYGQSADSVTLSLLRLAEQNVTGGKAATALNRAMSDLYIPTDAAAGALEKLGVSAYDADGKAKDFNDVVDELNVALSGMSEEEANAYKGAIFTSQGLKAFNMMTVSSTEKVNEFKEGLASASDGIGSAAQQALTMLDNLEGDITIFHSAVEGLQIGVSDNINGLLRDTVQFGTEQITLLTDAVKEGGLTGLAGAVGEVLSNLVTKIAEYVPKVLNLGIQVIQSLLEGISSSAGQIADIAADIVTTLVTGIIQLLPVVIQTACDLVVSFVDALASQLPTLIPVIVQGVLDAAQTLLNNLPVLLNALLNLIEGLAQGIINSIPIIVDALPEVIDSIITFMVNAIPQIVNTGVKLLSALVQNLPTIINAIVKAIPQIINSITSKFSQLMPQIVKAGFTLFVALIKNLPSIISSIVKAIPQIIKGIVDGFTGKQNNIAKSGTSLFTSLTNNISSIVSKICKAVPTIVTGIVNAFSNKAGTITNIGTNLLKGIFNGISNATSWLYGKLSGWVSNVLSYIKSKFGIHSPSKKTAVFGKYIAQGFAVGMIANISAVSTASKQLATSALKALDTASKSISGSIGAGLLNNTNVTKGVTISATYDSSALNALSALSNISSTLTIYSTGLNGAFDNFIDKSESLLDRWIDAIHVGNGGIKTSGNNITINMGDTTITGVVDKDAVETVKGIADKQINDVLSALSPYLDLD